MSTRITFESPSVDPDEPLYDTDSEGNLKPYIEPSPEYGEEVSRYMHESENGDPTEAVRRFLGAEATVAYAKTLGVEPQDRIGSSTEIVTEI